MTAIHKKDNFVNQVGAIFDKIDHIERKKKLTSKGGGIMNGPITFVPYIMSLCDRLDENQILIYKATTNVSEIDMHETFGYGSYDCTDNIYVHQNLSNFLTKERDFLRYHYENNGNNNDDNDNDDDDDNENDDDNDNENENDYYTEYHPTITQSRQIQNLPNENQINLDHEYKLFTETDSVCISRQITILSKNTESIQKIISFIKDNGKKIDSDDK